MRKLPSFLLLGLLCLLLPGLRAQGLAGARNLDRAVLIHLGYGPYVSAGDLNARFGNGWSLDGGAAWMPQNSNLALGFKVQFGFGNQVREDVLASLRTRDGFLIGNQREPADIQLRQRQLFVGPSLGYTLPIGSNQRAGLQLTSSVGYFFHRIKIQNDPVQSVPQLDEALKGGYDRLTGGPAFYQFIGFQQLAVDRLLNFYLGVEATVGTTRALRNFDFPTGAPPPEDTRLDALLGFKAGLIIPLYFGEGREIFYK
ncbi:hypothetical protein QWY85_13455 [Neolewinella lacunae]|uniref:Outer membrane protein beta-barrel domain-containing protein n=1 Tax=Neolewinella lacunae TaxID=1517758 RepID=A0A923TC33_9BACT|nr:hypothetical protein [Neolewinella lacunae]MBC6993282.1 hypothetical protein [Neolewinella lacunae]MDN3635671.1 hypothetical protein [Neolewinella lacunae]